MYRKYLILGIIFFLFLLPACSIKNIESKNNNQQEQPVPKVNIIRSDLKLVGNINGDLNIQMNLKFSGNEVSGTCYYGNSKTEIVLKGTVDNKNNIVLNEYGSKEEITGIFIGILSSQNVYEGTWFKPDGSIKKSFSVLEQKS